MPAESLIEKPTDSYAYPWVPLDPLCLVAIADRLIGQGVKYKLGGKASPIDVDSHSFQGTLGKSVDCSGWARYGLNKCLKGFLIPDGSQVQWAWVKKHGFKQSDVESAKLKDRAVRIAFLPVTKTRKIGHVVLIVNGKTLESHGGKGMDSRAWDPDTYHWMHDCKVYVLTPPV